MSRPDEHGEEAPSEEEAQALSPADPPIDPPDDGWVPM